jgi:hypothetical protein
LDIQLVIPHESKNARKAEINTYVNFLIQVTDFKAGNSEVING